MRLSSTAQRYHFTSLLDLLQPFLSSHFFVLVVISHGDFVFFARGVLSFLPYSSNKHTFITSIYFFHSAAPLLRRFPRYQEAQTPGSLFSRSDF